MSDLHRMRPEVDPVIIPMEAQHVPRVKTLWKTRFGADDEMMENWIEDVLAEGQPTEGFVASDGGNVLGFGIAAVSGPDYVEEYLNHPEVSADAWPKTGILHILCVDKDHESRGIGSRLVEARLRWLVGVENVDGVLGVSWNRENHRDSRPLFRKYGFAATAHADDFYKRAFGEVPCVDCDDICTCGATVFVRSFEERNSQSGDTETSRDGGRDE